MIFAEILNIGLLTLAFINICQVGYYRIIKDDTAEATFYMASAPALYLIATH